MCCSSGSFPTAATIGKLKASSSPIERALSGSDTDSAGVDLGALAEAEEEHAKFRQLVTAKVATTVWSEPFLSKKERTRVQQRGVRQRRGVPRRAAAHQLPTPTINELKVSKAALREGAALAAFSFTGAIEISASQL